MTSKEISPGLNLLESEETGISVCIPTNIEGIGDTTDVVKSFEALLDKLEGKVNSKHQEGIYLLQNTRLSEYVENKIVIEEKNFLYMSGKFFIIPQCNTNCCKFEITMNKSAINIWTKFYKLDSNEKLSIDSKSYTYSLSEINDAVNMCNDLVDTLGLKL